MIERELAEHDARLAALPRILALSKADLVTAGGGRGGRRGSGASGSATDVPVLVTSSATGAGPRRARGASCCAACRCSRRRAAERGARRRGRGGRVPRLPPGAPARGSSVERVGDGAFRVTGEAVERLIARHDLENEEALAHVEHRLRRMGVIARARGARASSPATTSRSAASCSSSTRARTRCPGAMPVAVVKLGSSIVAEDSGELRADVGRAHLRGGRRAARRAASTSSSSPRARSRAGCSCWSCRCARARSRSCRRPARSARAGSTAPTTSCCASAASRRAQVLLTFFDMSARTHYLNARRTLRKLLEWRIVPVINENDTTTTDEISFGDNDFLAAQVAVLVGADAARAADRHRRALHRRSARRPRRAARRARSTDFEALDGARDRPRDLAARLGRDALEGRRRPRWRRRPGSRR